MIMICYDTAEMMVWENMHSHGVWEGIGDRGEDY